MTARIIALLAAIAAMLAALVIKVMAVSVLAGTILASVLVGTLVLYAAYRLLATGGGQHAAPRGYAEADERLADTLERTIPRAVTEHAPPWDPAPAAVIEPAAVTQGPPPSISRGDWVLTAVMTPDGQVTELRAAVLPPLPAPSWPGDLHPDVAAQLGHARTEDAVESMFTRAMAAQVRQLTDGAA